MRKENKLMIKHLKANGIKASVKYIATGSLKGSWRLYDSETHWYNNAELQNKMKHLGFTDYDGSELNNLSGNGGAFSVFVRHTELTREFVKP